MDIDSNAPSWVERAVTEMRASQTYRSQVVDEWYETLPVPAWNGQATWLVVGFGKNTRTGDPARPVQSRLPHLTCTLRYPDGEQHWSVDNAAQRTWPSAAASAVPALPALEGGLMDRRRRYYDTLSTALKLGAFAGHVPADRTAACTAARSARAAFLPAAGYANLMPVYSGALADVDGWLHANCP